HSAPVLIVTVALALTLAALLRMTAVLETVSDTELVALHKEGVLHRGCWSIDVAVRQGESACRSHGSNAEAAQIIQRAAAELRRIIADTPSASADMRAVASRWLDVAEEVLRGDVCEALSSKRSEEH